ncbi:class I SAM-dependent methyltransferase [Micromonospora sp. STR1_7]|uniref:Class I SAM-dependent methyltransferase n=1 Tax=Micromonospora parastrephiae TaxID=2806101 RepID=A0ABS1XWH6_9ACTN|nr:class I SAM-dependent methyltransferase [Micromonospora parastrephiae]MBM0233593.1 class I SAM-dependent methyltransferase [Micromonospora parastrephiae]
MNLNDVRRDWTKLGTEDPLWAVLVQPGKRGGRWDVDEFLATGRADVEETAGWLGQLGLPTRWERVLDFGCGAGRLSQALAPHADQVVGVDIAPSMLETARHLDRSAGNIRFVLNDAPDLSQFPDGHFDLVYSALVLQHLPRSAIDRYLAEFLRVLRPGGIAVVGLPTEPARTAKGLIWQVAPFRLISWAQRRLLNYPAPMSMTAVPHSDMVRLVTAHGGTIVGQRPDLPYTEDWVCTRYAVRRG